MLPSDPYIENPYSQCKRSLSIVRKVVKDQTDSDESEYLSTSTDEETREEEQDREGEEKKEEKEEEEEGKGREEEEERGKEEKRRRVRSKTHDSDYASVEPAEPVSYRRHATKNSDKKSRSLPRVEKSLEKGTLRSRSQSQNSHESHRSRDSASPERKSLRRHSFKVSEDEEEVSKEGTSRSKHQSRSSYRSHRNHDHISPYRTSSRRRSKSEERYRSRFIVKEVLRKTVDGSRRANKSSQ